MSLGIALRSQAMAERDDAFQVERRRQAQAARADAASLLYGQAEAVITDPAMARALQREWAAYDTAPQYSFAPVVLAALGFWSIIGFTIGWALH